MHGNYLDHYHTDEQVGRFVCVIGLFVLVQKTAKRFAFLNVNRVMLFEIPVASLRIT